MSVRFVRICEDADKREIEIVGPINESMGLAETFLQTSQFRKIMKGAANVPNFIYILFNFPRANTLTHIYRILNHLY